MSREILLCGDGFGESVVLPLPYNKLTVRVLNHQTGSVPQYSLYFIPHFTSFHHLKLGVHTLINAGGSCHSAESRLKRADANGLLMYTVTDFFQYSSFVSLGLPHSEKRQRSQPPS